MSIQVNYSKTNVHLHDLLCELWKSDNMGISSYYWEEYESLKKELIDTLVNDVPLAISFFETLNLNDKVDAHIMYFIDEIEDALKTPKDKASFVAVINNLSEKFPDSPYVNWGVRRFNHIMDEMCNLDFESD